MVQVKTDITEPKFLVPRLRAFFSVDVVGSTALKQAQPVAFSPEDDRQGEQALSPRWLRHIASFYSDFTNQLRKSWEECSRKYSTGDNNIINFEEEFTLWKTIGDELVFQKSLKNKTDFLCALRVWIDALNKFRPDFYRKGLDVKSVVWTAGFPVANSEVAFSHKLNIRSILEENDYPYTDDPLLQRLILTEIWHGDDEKRLRGKHLSLDFIGPSIDVGFRLGTVALAQKLVLSVEAAWLFSDAHTALNDEVDDQVFPKKLEFLEMPRICFDGYREIKGVLAGHPYPVFFLKLGVPGHAELEKAESGIFASPVDLDTHNVKKFCKLFMERHKSRIINPFIIGEDVQHDKKPDWYDALLLRWKSSWETILKSERTRVAASREPSPKPDLARGARQKLERDIAKAEGSSGVGNRNRNRELPKGDH